MLLKGKCLAPGKGVVWPTGLYGLYFLKFHFLFSFRLYSLLGHVENRRFEQRRHSKVSLFSGQNINKHAGHQFPDFSHLLLSLQLPVLTTRIGFLSHLETLFSRGKEWMVRILSVFKDFWPYWIQILLFFWSLVPKCYNPAPWLPARMSQKRVEGGCPSELQYGFCGF